MLLKERGSREKGKPIASLVALRRKVEVKGRRVASAVRAAPEAEGTIRGTIPALSLPLGQNLVVIPGSS